MRDFFAKKTVCMHVSVKGWAGFSVKYFKQDV